MDKKEIRKKIKGLCLQHQEELAKKSGLICKKILASSFYQSAGQIFAYMALADEADLTPVIKDALARGKKVALPKIISQEQGIISFYYLDQSKEIKNQTASGFYGILEPEQDLPAATSSELKTLVLVPGRAFTKKGDRLGRGKGYYDRLLANLTDKTNIKKIGICFDFQLLPELPTDANDIKMDDVIYG